MKNDKTVDYSHGVSKLSKLFYNNFSFALIASIMLLSFCYIDFLPSFNIVIKYLSAGISLLCMIAYILEGKFTKLSTLLLVMFLANTVASLINTEASIATYLLLYTKLFGFSLYLEKCFFKIPNESITLLSRILWILVFINFATLIFFPNGLYSSTRYDNNWFFMYDNTHIVWYVAAILIAIIDNHINSKHFYSTLALFAMTTYGVFYCMSSTSVVVYSVFLLYAIFYKYLKNIRFLNYKTYLLIFIFFNILFVFLRVQDTFSWFIVEVLGKSLTFTGRTFVWDKVIASIVNKPWLGYGLEPTEVFTTKMGSIYYTHAHNTVLDICYKGGIISGICFSMILFSLNKAITSCKDKFLANFASIAMLCCFVMMIFEARQEKIGLYIVIVAVSCINHFQIKKRQAEKAKNE